jgi:hypothetical protein
MPPTPPVLIQTLTLTIDATPYEFQLSNAAVVPNYSDNAVQTFSGEWTTTVEKHALHLEGFQDFPSVTSLGRLLWESDVATDVLVFVLEVGGATFTGSVSPRKPNAGGAAGGPLDFQIDLPVQGPVAYVPPVAAGLEAEDEAELEPV